MTEESEINITTTTIDERIDEYFSEKRLVITEKIGDAVDNVDDDAGGAVRAYLLSGKMLRSILALICYDASGGDDDADDVAAIIEIVSNIRNVQDSVGSYNDYMKDVDSGIKSVMNAPGEIVKGNFGFIGNILDAVTGSPKTITDGIDVAKAAANSTLAVIWRGDYMADSPYISSIKIKDSLVMSIACRAGSEKAHSEECVELCHIYGRNIGVAYTVAEDMCKLISCIENNELEYDDISLAMLYGIDQCGTNVLVSDIDQKSLFKEIKIESNLRDAMSRLMIVYNKYSRNAIKAAERLPDNIYKEMMIALPEHLFTELKDEYEVNDEYGVNLRTASE